MERPLQRREKILSALFIGIGVLHFLRPQRFDSIVPPQMPLTPRQATYWSGAAEIAGGVGLLLPQTRPAARWGVMALLLAVFPANIYMAQYPEKFGVPRWVTWARLPLQPLLMWWVHRLGR